MPADIHKINALISLLESLSEDRCDMAVFTNSERNKKTVKRGTSEKVTCGTTACIAGWTALSLAPTLDLKTEHGYWASHSSDLYVPKDWAIERGLYTGNPDPDGDTRLYADWYGTRIVGDREYVRCEISDIARVTLGITKDEAQVLFYTMPGYADDDKPFMIKQLQKLKAESCARLKAEVENDQQRS